MSLELSTSPLQRSNGGQLSCHRKVCETTTRVDNVKLEVRIDCVCRRPQSLPHDPLQTADFYGFRVKVLGSLNAKPLKTLTLKPRSPKP